MRYLVAVMMMVPLMASGDELTPQERARVLKACESVRYELRMYPSAQMQDRVKQCEENFLKGEAIVKNRQQREHEAEAASQARDQKATEANVQIAKSILAMAPDADVARRECGDRGFDAVYWLANGTTDETSSYNLTAKFAEAKACVAELIEREDKLNAIRSNQQSMSVVYGATVCIAKRYRTAALDEIAKEKKYARVAGMVNKVKLYELQQHVRTADEMTAEAATDFGPRKIVAAPCTSPRVKAVMSCRDGGDCTEESALMTSFIVSRENLEGVTIGE